MVRLADVPDPERSYMAELECIPYQHKPFTPAAAPAQRQVAIVSSAGLIIRGQRPTLANDTGYRSLPADVADKDILCSHVSVNFDRSGFQQDINVMLPRDRLNELEAEGSIGKAAATHYAFMGATHPDELEDKAREVGRSMLALGVNTVVLAPVWPNCTRAVSGLAHFIEDEGLSTVVVALVREHVVKMSPPRALWVPFELGRPFATPNDVELQQRVLKAALDLLDEPGPEPILKDFAEEASFRDDDLNWAFPGKLDAESVIAEASAVLPIWHKARMRSSRTTVGISGLSLEAAVEYIDRYFSPDPMPNPKGMASVSRARFAIDDIKAFYFEAAFAGSGRPTSYQLNEWFWNQTRAGKMILDFQDATRLADDKNLRMVAGSLVPAERTYEYLNSA